MGNGILLAKNGFENRGFAIDRCLIEVSCSVIHILDHICCA